MPEFTEQQFFKETLNLRELFGRKDFWADHDKVIAAKTAYATAYFNTTLTDNVERTFKATMAELFRRGDYMGFPVERWTESKGLSSSRS